MDMLGSALSVFSRSIDFLAARREFGDVSLVAAGGGKFWARLSQIRLVHMRLLRCEERISRVSSVSVPANMVRITLPPKPDVSLISDGLGIRPGEIVTHTSGHRFHERTNGPSRWSSIILSAHELSRAGRATRGTPFVLPQGERRWRPAPDDLRSLVNLHDNAIRATAVRPKLPVGGQAAHGLEQELTLALIECLVDGTKDQPGRIERQRANLMTQFEDILETAPLATLSVTDIASALGVTNTLLRKCCHAHLGLAPGRYLYLRRMGLVLQALHDADPAKATVVQTAELHGFTRDGHFAAAYHAIFGELPSATLRRLRLW
jgi:AraC-like DNA-binding protein